MANSKNVRIFAQTKHDMYYRCPGNPRSTTNHGNANDLRRWTYQ